jgi:N6-L-threonylcarbamoyladenine synthase
VPELASRAHLVACVPVVERALAALPRGLDDVDGIAVTNGPGLVGALLVGVSLAKALAWSRHIPLVGVDHLEGHLLAVHLHRGTDGDGVAPPDMPYVALLASGGHTALYEVRARDDIEQIGQTRDDAAGEAFDKAAKLLGLGYPGGPAVDRRATTGDPNAVPLPTPMAARTSFDFSFSGLKTALAHHLRDHGVPETESGLADVCASFQRAVVESLVKKAVAACETRHVPRLVLTGGVAANRGLRARALAACERRGISLHVPPVASCTDNAAMIAYVGALSLEAGDRAGLDLAPYSRAHGYRRGKIRA